MKTVLVYRSDLLPPSETFIQAQAACLSRYKPHFIGLRSSASSLLAHPSCTLAEDHNPLSPRVRHLTYDTLGLQPRLHRRTLCEALRATQPQLIHAHFATDAATALPLSKTLNLPLIVTLHGYDVTADSQGNNPLRNRLRTRLRRNLQQHASLFLCVSEFIRRKAIEAGFPDEKLVVHRIGVDTRTFRRSGVPAQGRTVLFVGRLTEKKGCAYLLRAMASVQCCDPTARLVIIGEGPLRPALEALAKELEVDCSFLGRQDHQTVQQHIASARVCVVPSVTAANGDSEGLPMFLAEAQGLGVPIVATRHAGIPEGIVDGEGGMLSEERDVDGLAANILRVLTDDALHEDLSRRGAALVQNDFNLGCQTRRLEQLYDAVLTRAAIQPSSFRRVRITA